MLKYLKVNMNTKTIDDLYSDLQCANRKKFPQKMNIMQ